MELVLAGKVEPRRWELLDLSHELRDDRGQGCCGLALVIVGDEVVGKRIQETIFFRLSFPIMIKVWLRSHQSLRECRFGCVIE